MEIVLLSDLERCYVLQGVDLNCRTDGRKNNEYRPIEIETRILSHASGSASVRIGETFITCCVKMEVGKPNLNTPDEGRVEINVECYPTVTHSCNEKSAAELAEYLKTALQSAYQTKFLNTKALCIQIGRQSWIVYIDLLILESAGNLLDASSLVTKAALLDAMRSNQSLTQLFKLDNKDVNKNTLPLLVTVHKIGSAHIIDSSKEEEACSLSKLVTAVYPDGSMGSMMKEGLGSCQYETIIEMSELAVAVGKELNTILVNALELEEKLRA